MEDIQMTFRFAPYLDALPLTYQGKTRDTHDLGNGLLLIVATDRLSTHNLVHLSTIPRKGEVLTALTVFWLTEILKDLPHHLVAYGSQIYDHLPSSRKDYPDDLALRAIVVRKLEIIPVEFIFRRYLTGSLYDKFYSKGIPNPYGAYLRPGLMKMYKFHGSIFTPTEKSDTDDPLVSAEVVEQYPEAYELAWEGFKQTRLWADLRDLQIIDGKWEIGVDNAGQHFIADEVATPDSSRYARNGNIVVGQDPPWLDKQLARDEAERVWGKGKKESLKFAPLIIHRLVDVYQQLFLELTGTKLHEFQRQRLC